MKSLNIYLIATVTLLHLLGILIFSLPSLPDKTPKTHKTLAVNTKCYVPPPPVSTPKPVKKVSVKPTKKKMPQTKPKNRVPQSKDILKQLESNMAKLSENLSTTTIAKEWQPDVMPCACKLESSDHNDAPSFAKKLISYFQTSLFLPENGDVRLTIAVQPNGQIAIIDHVSSASTRNLEYLERTLPTLTLVPTEGHKTVELTITFSNA